MAQKKTSKKRKSYKISSSDKSKNAIVILSCLVAILSALLLIFAYLLVSPKKSVSPDDYLQQEIPSSSNKVNPNVNQNNKNPGKPSSKPQQKPQQNVPVIPQETVPPVQDQVSSINKPSKPAVVPSYNIPTSVNHSKIAFVIDDAGANINNVKKYASLPFKMNIAVLPKLTNTKACAYVVRSNNQELLLHQPMQSLNLNMNPGPGAILPDMTTYEIAQTVKENLEEVGPRVKGINNHEGSLITENAIKIGTVLDVASEEKVYFLDSRTTAATQAPQAALERDMTIYQRDVFIDDIIDKDEMVKQILRGIDIANKNGSVIMIGHVDKSVNILPDLLLEIGNELKSKGYEIVFVSEL